MILTVKYKGVDYEVMIQDGEIVCVNRVLATALTEKFQMEILKQILENVIF